MTTTETAPGIAGSTEAIVAALTDPVAAARILDLVAERTADARFRCAAGMLRGGRHGRPARADEQALSQMAALLREGVAATPEQAARFVARAMPGEVSTAATTDRLAKKFRRL